MVKNLINFSNQEADSVQGFTPYIEVGHKRDKLDTEGLLELMAHFSNPIFVDYPYFREPKRDSDYNEWKVNSEGNVFDTINELLKPSDLEKKNPGDIYSKLIPVISRIKIKGL